MTHCQTLLDKLRQRGCRITPQREMIVEELFPRMVIMDEGKIVADGPTDQLMEDAALLEAHGLVRM